MDPNPRRLRYHIRWRYVLSGLLLVILIPDLLGGTAVCVAVGRLAAADSTLRILVCTSRIYLAESTEEYS